jgi:transposase
LLDAEQRERLDRALDDPPPDGGLWTGRLVAQWICSAVWFHRDAAWNTCGAWGSLVRCRVRAMPGATSPPRSGSRPISAPAWKSWRARSPREEPDRSVQVWAFDEHRAGLKPVIRRVWARRGQRPLALGHHRFQWLYVFGFVRPATGEVVWFLADAVNTAMFSEILAAFAREVGAGPDNLVVLVLDGAGWHVATDLVVPEGIHLEFLPPYSPELQPAEHLWPLINEPLANRHFTTLADLDQALGERCRDLADDDDRIRSSTQFHWWPGFI